MANFKDMPKDQLKELAAKGGRNKKKKTIKDELDDLLIKSSNQKKLCQGLIDSAAKGNARAAELILKIIGEDPNKPQLVDEDNPFAD